MNYIRKAAVCISFLLLLSLTVYGAEEKADAAMGEDSAAQEAEIENTYKSILLGESNFICGDWFNKSLFNKSFNIKEIGQAVTYADSDTVSVERFAVIDLDGDGEDEVVLELDCYGGGFVILHYQNGEVYSFEEVYRGLMGLKEDGTFWASNGAVDNYTGKLVFSDTGYSKIELDAIKPDYASESGAKCYINGEPCSDDELIAAVGCRQEQKPDAQWYDFSEKNINAVFK